jgi:hypothetical protein
LLELPTTHRVPVSWLKEHASASIKLRTVTDVLPTGAASEADLAALRADVLASKSVLQTLKKQRKNGTWGDNLLGIAANRATGIKDVGTVAQYRHLMELGAPRGDRAFRLVERIFYRELSRDDDPELLFEHKAAAKRNPHLVTYARNLFREGAAAALANAGLIEDPRVRGAAHKIASDVSAFLRSELSEKPVVKVGSRFVLDPAACPPTIFSVAMFAYMPNLQRERAGFVERLCHFLAQPAPRKKWVMAVGKKVIPPQFHLLGNPIEVARGNTTADLPLALYWIELLARLQMLHTSEAAQKVLHHTLSECDEHGVWAPKNLRSLPKSPSRLADFWFPLETDGKTLEHRQADVTFRLAHIAKLAGWQLEYA